MLTINGLRLVVIGGIVMVAGPVSASVPIGFVISLLGITLVGHGLNAYPVLCRIVASR